MAELAVAPGETTLPAFSLKEGESVVSISLVNGAPQQHWQASSDQLLAPGQTKDFPPSTAARTALVFIASHTGQQVKRAAVGAEGWVLDPFSHQAVATHLHAVGEPLVKAFGAAPPYAIFSDSLEAYGADWTPNLPGNSGAAAVTICSLTCRSWWPAAVRKRKRSAMTGENADGVGRRELSAPDQYLGRRPSHPVPLADLWGAGSQFIEPAPGRPGGGRRAPLAAFSTLRWASSANHLFGRNVTSAETFTWLHSPVFRATPLDMKAEVDLHFLMGVNQVIGHGWPYSPPQVSKPGWSLYAAAVFNDHNPWHPVMPDVTRYIERNSFLLRQGQPANQVAVLLPTDDAWARFSPGKVSVTAEMEQLIAPELMSSILSAGYNVDYMDADAIEKYGIHYPVLVVPPTDRIPVTTLLAIQRYVAGGGKAIAVGRAPSHNENGESTPDLSALSRQIFDQSKSAFVADPSALASALRQAVSPDFKLDRANDDVGFIRRKLPDADIYFVANTANHPASMQATFATTHKFGQRWDADTGTAVSTSGPAIALSLAPYESAIFVFSDEPSHANALPQPGARIADLSDGWKVTFTGMRKTISADVTADWASDPATRFYSGEAVYEREFTLRQVPGGAVFLEAEGGLPVTKPDAIERTRHEGLVRSSGTGSGHRFR